MEFPARQQSVDSCKWNSMHTSPVAKSAFECLAFSNKKHFFLLKKLQNALFDENIEQIDVLWQSFTQGGAPTSYLQRNKPSDGKGYHANKTL